MNEDGTRARGVIAVIIGLTFAAALLGLFFLTPNQATEKYLILLVGCLITLVTTVINFYFGTSSGAKQLVANQQSLLAAAVPAAAASSLGGPGAPTGAVGDPVSVTVEPEDPKLTEYRKSMLAIDKSMSEEAIVASWKGLQAAKPDVVLP